MNGLLGVRAAAAALGLSASTVSRYVRAHPELNQGGASRPRIDPDALAAHRRDHVNGAMAGNHAGALMAPENGKANGKQRDDKPKITYAEARTAHEALKVRKAQVALDEQLGRLVPRIEVEDGAAEAAQAVQNGLLSLGRELAERLAAMTDPGEIAALIESEHRRVLSEMARILMREETSDAA